MLTLSGVWVCSQCYIAYLFAKALMSVSLSGVVSYFYTHISNDDQISYLHCLNCNEDFKFWLTPPDDMVLLYTTNPAPYDGFWLLTSLFLGYLVLFSHKLSITRFVW